MPEAPVHRYRLEAWLERKPHLDRLEVISLELGADTALYILAIVFPVDYREQRAGASFAKSKPARPNTFATKQAFPRFIQSLHRGE